MKIALVSLNQIWLDNDSNISQCKKYIDRASSEGCELIIFPEATLTGFSTDNTLSESTTDSKTLKMFSNLSTKYNINIIFGAFLKRHRSSLPYNSLCLSDNFGNSFSLYNKIHLFSYANEEKFVLPGSDIKTKKIGDISFGFSICYDLRFPEIFSIMASDCDVLIVIANWPIDRISHWYSLLKARAIENQCFMIGVNRTGVDGNKIYYSKSSIIIDPNGEIIPQNSINSLLDVYNIDYKVVNDSRIAFPTLKDKNLSFYCNFLK